MLLLITLLTILKSLYVIFLTPFFMFLFCQCLSCYLNAFVISIEIFLNLKPCLSHHARNIYTWLAQNTTIATIKLREIACRYLDVCSFLLRKMSSLNQGNFDWLLVSENNIYQGNLFP